VRYDADIAKEVLKALHDINQGLKNAPDGWKSWYLQQGQGITAMKTESGGLFGVSRATLYQEAEGPLAAKKPKESRAISMLTSEDFQFGQDGELFLEVHCKEFYAFWDNHRNDLEGLELTLEGAVFHTTVPGVTLGLAASEGPADLGRVIDLLADLYELPETRFSVGAEVYEAVKGSDGAVDLYLDSARGTVTLENDPDHVDAVRVSSKFLVGWGAKGVKSVLLTDLPAPVAGARIATLECLGKTASFATSFPVVPMR
jgi:hypothetical protein